MLVRFTCLDNSEVIVIVMNENEKALTIEQIRATEDEKMLVKIWLEKMLCADFEGKETIRTQINYALKFSQFTFFRHYANVFVGFHINEAISLLPWKMGVPISMDAFQQNAAPIFFVLHTKNGFIIELEVGTADASEIDIFNIDLSDVVYSVE